MNNDYLFRAVMQTDTEVFAMLLSSLLRTQCCADDIEILNPIELGKQMQEKDFVLDTKLKLRNDIVNVEMQLWLQGFWKERAMTYLCRIFDSLKVGEPYDRLKTAIHIGIIDFVLPDVRPELYAEYMLKNVKTGEVFSDKMRLNVLCLKHEKLATESDIENGLLFWVKYFIASTWEDLIMLANDNPVMEKPISAAVRLSEEDRIREMILLREEAIRVRRSELSVYAKAEKDLKEARTQIGALTKKLDSAEQERDSAVQDETRLCRNVIRLCRNETRLYSNLTRQMQRYGVLKNSLRNQNLTAMFKQALRLPNSLSR